MQRSLPQPIHTRPTIPRPVLPRPVRDVVTPVPAQVAQAPALKQKRGPRSDRGSLRISAQHIELMRYMAGVKFVNLVHLSKWLGIESERNTKRFVRRWEEAGLVEVVRMHQSWWAVYLTAKAYRYLPELDVPAVTAPRPDKSFSHDFAVATIAQRALRQGEAFVGEKVLHVVYEREIRRRLYTLKTLMAVDAFEGEWEPDMDAARTPEGSVGNEHAYVLHERGPGGTHIPDLVLVTESGVIAVEVERGQKPAQELARIARHYTQSELYTGVRYYYPTSRPGIRRQVEAQAVRWGGESNKFSFEAYDEAHFASIPSKASV